MKAVIMAGGEGTRLRPLTSRQPKPMLPVVNRPMMEHVVALLKRHGFEEIIVTVAYLAGPVRDYFGNGAEFGVNMVYATEETPLGTAGSVRNAMEQLSEPFLAISGDVLTDIDLTALVKTHSEKGGLVTIALKEMEDPLEFGIAIRNEAGFIERFLEKPTWGQVFSDTINTGICVANPEIFDFIPEGTRSDFANDVFPKLLATNKPIFGHIADGYWTDVGTLESYLTAHFDVLDGKVKLDIPGFRLENGVWLGEGAEIDPLAKVEGPAVIGTYATVEAGARLGGYAVIGSNVRVREGADVQRSVVHDNAYIGPEVRLRGTVLGRAADLRRSVRCEQGAVIGEEAFVGEHSVIAAGVKIYPRKEVESGTIVNNSIVWESRGSRHIFGQNGVSGLANVDITPELAVRVAMAFGSTLQKGSLVTISRDSSRIARTVMRAIASGLNATGVGIVDLEVSTIPVTRFHVGSGRASAAVTARLVAGDPQSVVIRFFDSNGQDLDETAHRKVERIFYREDFRRVSASEIGDIVFQPRATEYYVQSLVEALPIEIIRDAHFKVVLDYSYGSASFVMPTVLPKIDAEVLAVNPFGSTRGMLRFDASEHATRVAALVQSSGAHLGAVFDPDGERIVLIDDNGHVLSDEECRLSILTLMGQTRVQNGSLDNKIVVPVSAPLAVERIAEQYGLQVIPTKLHSTDVMRMSTHHGVILGAGNDSGYIFPKFLAAYDSISTFVNVIGMIAQSKQRLSEVVAGLPTVHMVHEEVETPWEQTGQVMRSLIENIRGQELVLIDGVKVRHGENRGSEEAGESSGSEEGGGSWVLISPDPEKPFTHIWAEANSIRDARALLQQYVRQIRYILRSQ